MQEISLFILWWTERGGRGSVAGVVVWDSQVIVGKQTFMAQKIARSKSTFPFNDLRFPTARCSLAGPRLRQFDLLVIATCRWRWENRKFIYTQFIHAVPIQQKTLRLEYSRLGRYAVWIGKQLTFRRSVAPSSRSSSPRNAQLSPLKMETLYPSETTVFTRQQA